MVWSVIIGLIIDVLIMRFTLHTTMGIDTGVEYFGWPFVGSQDYWVNLGGGQSGDSFAFIEILNLIFWGLVSFMVLSLIRYYRNKKVSAKIT